MVDTNNKCPTIRFGYKANTMGLVINPSYYFVVVDPNNGCPAMGLDMSHYLGFVH